MKTTLILFLAVLGLASFASAGTVFTFSNYQEWYDWYLSDSYIKNWYWAGENSFFDYTYTAIFQYYSSFTFTYAEYTTITEPTTYWTTEYWTTLDTSYLQSSSSDAFTLIPSVVIPLLSAIAFF